MDVGVDQAKDNEKAKEQLRAVFDQGVKFAPGYGSRNRLIFADQIRAVDKVRLAKKTGSVSAKTLSLTLDTLKEDG
jgi:hypothetical protein